MDGVDGLDKELAELKGFIADLKADREAQKEKERREAWTKHTAISLVFIAVLAALAAQWSGKFGSQALKEMNNATFYQALATDQWGYYQAKSIKQNLYEAMRELASRSTGGNGTNAAAALEAFNAKIAKYESDKAAITNVATRLEGQRDTARDAAAQAGNLGGRMGMAMVIFQIAVAIGSICLVTKKRPLWYLSLGIAAVAALKMIQVWVG
jgi:hypothetical protein